MPEAKRLVVDIETRPITAYVWSIWEQNVGLNQIAEDWSMLSFAAKWVGKPRIIYGDTGGRGVKKIGDDKGLCLQLWELLDEADIVIGQNSDAFDLKKIHARMLKHGLRRYSPVKTVDTKKVAKRHFGFTSNKLEYMSEFVTPAVTKSKHKKFPGFELWLEVMKDNPSAWAEMKKYNIQDVRATEALYLKMLGWIDNHPNMAAYHDGVSCTQCDSRDLQARGFSVTRQGRYQRFQCQACGGWQRAKGNLINHNDRKYKMA